MESIKSPAVQEVNSQWRLGIFAYLALVPLIVMVQGKTEEAGVRAECGVFQGEDRGLHLPSLATDLLSSEPLYGQDALYGAIGAAMVYNVWNERRALSSSDRDEGEPK